MKHKLNVLTLADDSNRFFLYVFTIASFANTERTLNATYYAKCTQSISSIDAHALHALDQYLPRSMFFLSRIGACNKSNVKLKFNRDFFFLMFNRNFLFELVV